MAGSPLHLPDFPDAGCRRHSIPASDDERGGAPRRRAAGAAKRATDKFSLAEWRETDDLAKTLQPHIWLGFAVLALREQKYRVEVVSSPARPGERFRHRFHDAMVHPAPIAGAAKA